ncbi:MAG TPA: DegT/DnrJ/EryC1/StrS family aminotransferase [Candidatus Paceibacterota bacterium]
MISLFNTSLSESEIELIERVLRSGKFVIGPEIDRLEQELGVYLGGHAVGCGSGTDALILALEEFLPRNSCVIVPSMTFSATAEAVIRAGGTPVCCDVDEDYLTPSLDNVRDAVEEAIYAGHMVSGVVLVHLYGWPAFDLLSIKDFCDVNGLFLIEDCAQAFGAKLHGHSVGTFGHAGCYSFYPTKALGGIGDAGAVFFHEKEAAERIRIKRNHGRSDRGQLTPGINSRIDEPNAALLNYRLLGFDEENAAVRRRISHRYTAHGLNKLAPTRTGHGVPYVYPILVQENREAVRFRLAEAGVQTGTHYDPPVSKLPYAESFCPNAEWAAQHIVTLPCHHGMTEEDADRISDALRVVAA